MSRRSSIPSASISAPAIANGHVDFQHPLKSQDGVPANKPRSTSLSGVSTLNDVQGSEVDPDELFTKHTISEIKFIQQRLRADADAKQEELRLMVGERYRDLLQASSSIIAIAQSSQRVKEALEETRDDILSQEEPPTLQQPSVSGSNDAHLHTLQLLSAHMKLLLDAPEHMWRLIERKKYYPAAWLFLLAGVVHRVLVRGDDSDREDGAWRNQGIDVSEQFPLIQRQWDAVSQFRSQIIHKATISLREHSATVEDTCATLLTLHLLESRPLTETFSVFLTQRTKTLQTSVSWNYQADASDKGSSDLGTKSPPSEFRRKPVNKIREATHAALGVISQTCKTARYIFCDNHPRASLIRRVLEYIQSDSPALPLDNIPLELRLTTQTLLTTLPSSTHLLLLPQSLRSYKPYVDLNSPSSSIQHPQFTQKMGEWFHRSSLAIHKAIEKWLSNLESVREVWNIRSSTRAWISSSQLEQEEITQLICALDNLCQQRAIDIWSMRLNAALDSFEEKLKSATSSFNAKPEGNPELSLAEFLFQAPPLPLLSQSSTRSTEISFQKYKNSLRRQIVGRTTQLDELLSTLERCARAVQRDLLHVKSSGGDAEVIFERLTNTYEPKADALCASVVQKLEMTYQGLNDSSQVPGLVLLGRVAAELSSSSPFVSEIGCSTPSVTDFRTQTSTLHGDIINHWQKHIVSQIVRDHPLKLRQRNAGATKPNPSSGPSAYLVHSLLSLSRSIEQLGAFRSPSTHKNITQTSLRRFITEFVQDGWENSTQYLDDLAFLWKLAEIQGAKWSDTCQLLDDRMEAKLSPGQNPSDLKRIASEYLTRTQTLFTMFLPPKPPSLSRTSVPISGDKFASLFSVGVPILEQQFQSVIDSAKPSSRFGLLLVGGA